MTQSEEKTFEKNIHVVILLPIFQISETWGRKCGRWYKIKENLE